MSKRNGLLDLYRIFFCFWAMYAHDFFFLPNDGVVFSGAKLAPDFFFILSGAFLLDSFRKTKDMPIGVGLCKVFFARLRPMLFSLIFIASFNLISIALFVREDILGVLFIVFRYWWYVFYLLLAVILLYLLYRAVKSERSFFILMGVSIVTMSIGHYILEYTSLLYPLTFFARAFAMMPMGILISLVPNIPYKKFNPSIPIVIALIAAIVYLSYIEKSYLLLVVCIVLFCALIYFSRNLDVRGAVFDVIGKLSMRMYLYMAFISMLWVLGLTNHRVLFVIDVALASMDMLMYNYKTKYLKKKKEGDKEDESQS